MFPGHFGGSAPAWFRLRVYQLLYLEYCYAQPLMTAASALRIEAPAAPIIVLCDRPTKRRSHTPEGSSRTRPTLTANPRSVSLSSRGCGLSGSSITTIDTLGADGHPKRCASETYVLIASLISSTSGGGRFLNFSDTHDVCPSRTITRLQAVDIGSCWVLNPVISSLNEPKIFCASLCILSSSPEINGTTFSKMSKPVQ